MSRFVTALAALAVLAACDGTPAAPDLASDRASDGLITGDAWYAGAGPGAMPIRVFQQNVYPGFSVDKVEAALVDPDPTVALFALTNGLLVFEQTDWRSRAAAMAMEIERQDPHVITLNEAVTITRQGFREVAPALEGSAFDTLATLWSYIPSGTVDFLPVFQEELAKRGLDYVVVRKLTLTDIMIPVDLPGLPAGFVYARYVDNDAMLVRADVMVANATTHVYDVALETPFGIQTRGWIAADVSASGKTWRVVTTHPEPAWPVEPGETPMIPELIQALQAVTHPVLVTGDLNFVPGSPQYGQMTAAGYVDLWTERLGPAIAEETCCRQDETLQSPLADDPLTSRKDYVWARPAAGYEVGPVKFLLFGDDPFERTTSGLWPSDHLGLPVGVVLQKAK